MSLASKMKRALRGEVNARAVARELFRRGRVSLQQRRERATLFELQARPARLRAEFARLTPVELLAHFQERVSPNFLPGFDAEHLDATVRLQQELFPIETAQLLERAARITDEHRWTVLGYGEMEFGREINWLRDPLSGRDWPLDYHCDISLARDDGSDARVLWEVNRLAHLITLARAFAVTKDTRFTDDVFAQLDGWSAQNPPARGANWACAMEVALRSMNLLAVFELLRRSPELTEARLSSLLKMLDQHGSHIRRHLEFSYVSTSNHYLSDVVGLLWLGLMLPEFEAASEWRAFALREMLSEMDKQTLSDGADFEASTGYHRLALELFLYSFLLCRANGVSIDERRWRKLRAMLDYVRVCLRPDGRAPLIGDTDSGQVLPVNQRNGDDHAYLLPLGAVVFNEPRFKLPPGQANEELLWLLGADGISAYEKLRMTNEPARSQAFMDAGTCVMREGDLYMLLNASDSGLEGRGSHGHNDALSLEVSACHRSFIVDPGTFVYTANLGERHLFRSTAYHSTVEVDGAEQNSTDASTPFVIGNEARPRVLRWEVTPERDTLLAEHYGYRRLASPVTHRRAVEFDKRERRWIIEDVLLGEGAHEFRFRFHFADDLEVAVRDQRSVQALDTSSGARLFILTLDFDEPPQLEPRFVSRDYGAKSPSLSACWTKRAQCPVRARWAIVPLRAGESEESLKMIFGRLKKSAEQESA
ncbi:MAG TPA: alginate lyase family protein [Pyrinomonadaceae bacterium]